MAELHADLHRRFGMNEIDDALPAAFLLVVPQTGAARRDARIRRRTRHLHIHKPRPAHGARGIMCEMPIVRHAIDGGILVHRRNNHAICQRQAAQLERREHGRGPALAAIDAGFFEIGLIPLILEGAHEGFVADQQIVPGDALGAAHDDHRELHRLHVVRALHVLEPGQADIGIVLGDLHFGAAGLVISAEGPLHGFIAMRDQCIRQCDGGFHRQLGAGADGKMRRGLRIAQKHDVLVPPLLAENARKIAPERAVGDERMAFQLLRENRLQLPRTFLFAQLVEAKRFPSLRACLHHPGRVPRFILIGVRADQAMFCLLEEEGETFQRARGAEPGELVRLQRQRRLEMLLEHLADAAVDAVRAHDHTAIGQAGEIVHRRLIVDRDAHILAAPLEYLQQRKA